MRKFPGRKPTGVLRHGPLAGPVSGRAEGEREAEVSFRFAKFLSWTSLVLILVSGLFFSLIITNSARETLLTKQREFSLLLTENLNHQIYRRFTLPTLIGFGRIALKQQAQYDRLDQVVRSTIHGLHVGSLQIYDTDGVLAYDLENEGLGEKPETKAITAALAAGRRSFTLDGDLTFLQALVTWQLETGTVTLTTTSPLRAEPTLSQEGEQSGPIMGVLELTQDISADYQQVVNFQWLTIATSLASSLLLFLVLLLIFRRADRINVARLKEKERLERELNQAEKLASMGRMVAGIAHEIRNPLGIIRSSAELLLRSPAGKGSSAAGAGGQESLNTRVIRAIHDESKRLSQTVTDFLDYARPRTPKQEEMDLALVLDQALIFLEGELDKHAVTVHRDYAPPLPARGDKDLIYRAVFNVMVNALQAMEGPGFLTISAAREGSEIVLSVEDSGPGFSSENQDKLLDPFFTTKETGTGLGLTIVKSIIESHGGTLALGSGKEGGAKVVFRLPAV